MSVDYDLVCHKHKECVSLCSDGMSGPLTNCDKSMAAFAITHRDCDLKVLDEHQMELCEDYEEWGLNNWKDNLKYDK
jgi:hypothetical protein